ncbi:T9SS type A sorting domain-containing protein [Tamlana haliotis]|uniref:T9SS type A sorting domain-containing protein n=1 Tax=Pseudotamlana haliotis TaxID=2614804 RepID=A0A6N6MD27_9FLAO|nr:T9SS type A sorting domain-containing protein [Tamlana haliotis]KAB1068111.1 T9SS type A sorting domain-containing protein [Tamlana haliotis]
MKKPLLLNLMMLIFSISYGQINFDDKVDIYDFYTLSNHIIYDDFDNDNDIDLIKHGTINTNNVLLQKNENGNFNANPAILLDSGILPIISLDINNDNYPDLITYKNYNTLSVLYNLQNDTFSEEQPIQNFNGSYNIHPIKIDYNNDGFMDLIAIDNKQDAYVLLNNRQGGLESAKFLIHIGTFNYIFKVEDFNNDGNLDIYVWDYNRLLIYVYNEEEAQFVQPFALNATSNLETFGIIDLDKNGYKDIFYLKDGAVWAKYFDLDEGDIDDEEDDMFIVINDQMVVNDIPVNNYDMNTHKIHIENNDGVYSVYVAILTTENHYNIYKFDIQDGVFGTAEIVLENFEIKAFGLTQFKFLDLNNDNSIDFTFTATNFFNHNKIFINNDINELDDKTICIQQSILPNKLTVIDMNGDGVEDICVGEMGGLAYFEKTSANKLGEIQNLIGVETNPNTTSLPSYHIIDINNNGLGDVVDIANNTEHYKFYKNLGSDNFEFIQSIDFPDTFIAAEPFFTDVDSDGFKDLIVYNLIEKADRTSDYYWSKNNNGLDFGALQSLTINGAPVSTPNSFAFDDFNDDGKVDMLVLCYYYANNKWQTQMNLLENENGEFTGKIVTEFSGSYSHLKVKDFDQDGDLDFFVYSIDDNYYYDNPFLFFKNNGQNNFQSIVVEDIYIEDIEFSDNDGDGVYEIYAWNHGNYTNNIFYYKTTDYLNFTKVEIDSYESYNDASHPISRGDLLLYDYNNDGNDDLFISNSSVFYGLISVYNNLSETLEIEDAASNVDLKKLQIYPNPFVNAIHWGRQENEVFNVKLYSQNGQLILEKTTSENKLDLTAFNSGIYLLVIKESVSGTSNTYKILKK